MTDADRSCDLNNMMNVVCQDYIYTTHNHTKEHSFFAKYLFKRRNYSEYVILDAANIFLEGERKIFG